jgi:hypothetical protein
MQIFNEREVDTDEMEPTKDTLLASIGLILCLVVLIAFLYF